MNKIFLAAFFIVCVQVSYSQIDTVTTNVPKTDTSNLNVPGIAPVPVTSSKKQWSKIDLSNRSNDHFMFQFGSDTWMGTNDSISPKGFSRFFNFYIMLDKPFKTNPKFSVGLGLGFGSSNMFFKNTYVDIKSNTSTLPFSKVDSVDHFKKFKLTTIYLEAPVELRFSSDPERNGKSFKIALGAKVGTMLKAYTKGKTLLNSGGNTINNYIEKQSDKRFFNSTRLAGTARIGYGILSVYGAYQLTSLFKDGAGPTDVKPYSIGICLSGL